MKLPLRSRLLAAGPTLGNTVGVVPDRLGICDSAPVRGGCGAKWDVTADSTSGPGGCLASNVDTTTTDKRLQSLTDSGPKADLRVFFTSCGVQDYPVAVPRAGDDCPAALRRPVPPPAPLPSPLT